MYSKVLVESVRVVILLSPTTNLSFFFPHPHIFPDLNFVCLSNEICLSVEYRPGWLLDCIRSASPLSILPFSLELGPVHNLPGSPPIRVTTVNFRVAGARRAHVTRFPELTQCHPSPTTSPTRLLQPPILARSNPLGSRTTRPPWETLSCGPTGPTATVIRPTTLRMIGTF
jgi:hypothetical protein